MDRETLHAELDAEGPVTLTRHQYERLVQSGALDDERLELLFGRLVPMSPQGWAHAQVVEQLVYKLIAALGDRARVRAHSPLALSDDSEPEPDVLVYPSESSGEGHPTRAHLVVEVADSSLRRDRVVKAALYAQGGVPEFWVVDLVHRCVHVHRSPGEAGYQRIVQVQEADLLDIQAFPDVRFAVGEVLP